MVANIHNMAQISPTELGALIGILASMLAGFYALLSKVIGKSSETQEKDRAERIALAKAIERMAKASEKTAEEAKLGRKAQEKGFAEAKQRNGHLGEQSLQLAEMLKTNKSDILNAVNCIKEQRVETQIVEHETVNNKE